jgi:hypothetical protein
MISFVSCIMGLMVHLPTPKYDTFIRNSISRSEVSDCITQSRFSAQIVSHRNKKIRFQYLIERQDMSEEIINKWWKNLNGSYPTVFLLSPSDW